MVLPRVALPFILPRCTLRCFTLLGANILFALLEFARCGRFYGCGAQNVALVYPHLNAENAERGVRDTKAVIDIGTERLQRNGTLLIMLGTRDFRTVETTADLNLNALSACVHSLAHRLFHSTTEERALFELCRNTLGKQLRVEVGVLDFYDIDIYLFAARQLFEVLFKLVDADVLLPDYLAGKLRMDRDLNLALRALYNDLTDAAGLDRKSVV